MIARRFGIGLSAFLFLVSGFSAQAAPYVVGTWYGLGEPHDKHEMWLDHLLPDGSFNGQYRTCVKGKAIDNFQTGTWSLTGDTLTIAIITADGNFSPRNDVYKTVSQDARHWTYRFMPTGFVFNAERVDNNYTLTSCEAVS